MTRYWPVLVGSVLLASAAGAAAALAPEQVVIVANANVPESLVVASYYARERQIDPSQIIALRTTAGYSISWRDYNSQIVQPLREALLQRGLAERTRCLALMWGVPVRVWPPKDVVGEFLTAEATKAHYRLAVDYKLLSTVGRTFPPPRTTGLEPLAELFESPTPAVPEPLPEWAALLKDVDTMLELKYGELKAMPPGAQKEIAARQLMALYRDLRGLEGLIQFLHLADLSDTSLLERLQRQLDEARARLEQLRAQPAGLDNTKAVLATVDEVGGVAAVGAYCQEHRPSTSILRAGDAAVDSELAMLWADDYPLDRQLVNPLSWRFRRADWAGKTDPPAILMTARIDGPTHSDALRIIRESVQTEQAGLSGNFYIDAGGPERAKRYDEVFRRLYRYLKATTSLNVVLDDSVALFPPGSCPNAALYVGWYSLQKYVPAFQWVPGAVGWHVASFEAMHLRDPSSEEWCPQMIRGGVAATMGAVDEPTLGTIPPPQEFFALLLTGRYTVAECYWRTTPVVSWRMTLIADPLYSPFKANPQLATRFVPPTLLPPNDWPPGPVSLMSASTSGPATATAPSAPSTPATTSAPTP